MKPKNIIQIENINYGKCPECDLDMVLDDTADKDREKYYCDYCDCNWILFSNGPNKGKLVKVDENYNETIILTGKTI